MSTALDNIHARIERSESVTQSAVDLLSSLSQQIRDNAEDPAALQALAEELDANTDKLANAVSANTPAAATAPATDTTAPAA